MSLTDPSTINRDLMDPNFKSHLLGGHTATNYPTFSAPEGKFAHLPVTHRDTSHQFYNPCQPSTPIGAKIVKDCDMNASNNFWAGGSAKNPYLDSRSSLVIAHPGLLDHNP